MWHFLVCLFVTCNNPASPPLTPTLPEDCFKFEPLKDITAYELSYIWARTSYGLINHKHVDVQKGMFDREPATITRHFVYLHDGICTGKEEN